VLGADGATSFIPGAENVSAGGLHNPMMVFPGFGSYFVAIALFSSHSQRC
jgi:hypothetical protein